MKKISDWIDGIVEDLVDPKNQLKDILLKVVILANRLKNPKLKEWVDSELNGYVGKTIPSYRQIPTAVYGNLIQDRGFGGYATRNHNLLPIEFLGQDADAFKTINVSNGIAELEKMVKDNEEYTIPLPKFFNQELSRKLTNNWVVDSSWQIINKNYIEGVLSSVKNNLLKFLLELNDELGNDDDFTIMQKKKNIEKSFDKTIGSIQGDTVHVNVGNNNLQTVNSGDDAKMNIASGKTVHQKIDATLNHDLKSFLSELKSKLDLLNLSMEDSTDVRNEMQRISDQIERSNPKISIISGGLKLIYDVLIGVGTNAYTQVLLDKLNLLLSQFQ